MFRKMPTCLDVFSFHPAPAEVTQLLALGASPGARLVEEIWLVLGFYMSKELHQIESLWIFDAHCHCPVG